MSAALYNVVFERCWSKNGEHRKRSEARSDGCKDELVVAARDVEEAIAKLKKLEIGYLDEEEQLRITGIVIVEVTQAGRVDVL